MLPFALLLVFACIASLGEAAIYTGTVYISRYVTKSLGHKSLIHFTARSIGEYTYVPGVEDKVNGAAYGSFNRSINQTG